MDPNKAKALSKQIWLHRLRTALSIIAVPVLIAVAAALYIWHEVSGDQTQVYGVVESWTRQQTETGSGFYVLSVTLPDGSRVHASAGKTGRAPEVGERIELVQRQTPTGLLSYRWVRNPPETASE